MKKIYRPGLALAYLAASIMLEQAIGLITISRRVTFSVVPAVFIAQAPSLSLAQALAYAVGLGALYDIRSPAPFGVFVLAYTALAAAAKFLERYVASGRFLPAMVLGSVTLAIFYAVLVSARHLWGGESLWWRQMPAEVLWNVGVLFLNTCWRYWQQQRAMSDYAKYR